ncbi:MAG: amidase [Ectothiorhodospiraceae bacterium]|nr:amidase [Chromatiales bacterium]MCP5153609.1 amidase [Ectothiorhodospiraceae bacterium]
MSEAIYRSASRLAAAIRAGETTAADALEGCIDRIERLDGAFNAVCVRMFDEARGAARAADAARARGERLGPLHGVPVTVKEAYDVAGTATTWGLVERRDHVAVADSEVVRRLRAAGAVILGKTNVPPNVMDWQSDNPLYGRTCNPWDVARTPGGSSGGSAVALAAGYAFLEAGSDIGGSLRNPAHFCGVCAHKPSFGVVPDSGHRIGDPEEAIDLLVCGPMARHVEDLELGMEVMAGPEPRDAPAWRLELPPARRRRLADLRIAVVAEEPVCRVGQAVKDAVERVAAACENAGARVDRAATLPFDSRSAHRTFIRLLRGAGAAALSDEQLAIETGLAASAGDDPSGYRGLVARAFVQSHRDWLRADAERLTIRRAWSSFFQAYDVLLCPVAPTPAWPHDPRDRYDRIIDVDGVGIGYFDQLLWSGVPIMSYLPSTAIPAGLSPQGLPVGVQVVADYLEDRTALAAARMIEAEIGGFVPPPSCVG